MTIAHESVLDRSLAKSPETTIVGRVPVYSDTEGNLGDSGMLISEIGLSPAFGPRLSLVSEIAIPTADVIGATHVYVQPSVLGGNLVILPNGTGKVGAYYNPIDIQLTPTRNLAASGYDVWMGISSGNVVAGTGPAWASATTASSTRGTGAGTTEFEIWNGLFVNKNEITVWNGTNSYNFPARSALLVGSFRTVAAGETQDTKTDRWVSSLYSPATRILERIEPTQSWVYSAQVWRLVNANALNQLSIFQCIAGRDVEIEATATFSNTTATYQLANVGIGKNSVTVNSAQILQVAAATSSFFGNGRASFKENSNLGLTGYAWIEQGAGADAQTWRGTLSPVVRNGILGRVLI